VASFVEKLLAGKRTACPLPAVRAFLCPTMAVEDVHADVCLLTCDPVRLLVLCRLVVQSFADLEHCAFEIAGAFALKACLQPEAGAGGSTEMVRSANVAIAVAVAFVVVAVGGGGGASVASSIAVAIVVVMLSVDFGVLSCCQADGSKHPLSQLFTLAGLATPVSAAGHPDRATAVLADLQDQHAAMSLILTLLKPPSSASYAPDFSIDGLARGSRVRNWVMSLVDATSSEEVAAVLLSRGLSVPLMAALLQAPAELTSPVNACSDVRLLTPHWVSLLPLPTQYDLLFGKLCSMTCTKCGKQPETPVLCLVCGGFFCGGTSSDVQLVASEPIPVL
jgi:hypothetical protein